MASEGDLYCRVKGQGLDLVLMTCWQQVTVRDALMRGKRWGRARGAPISHFPHESPPTTDP